MIRVNAAVIWLAQGGVHRSISPAEQAATVLPDYVGRSHDSNLRRWLYPVPTNGVLNVLVGGSSIGKRAPHTRPVDALLRHTAENGHAWAVRRLAGLLIDDGIEYDDDPELLEEGRAWLRRAADARRVRKSAAAQRAGASGQDEDAVSALLQRATTDDQDILLDVAAQFMNFGHDGEATEVLRRLIAGGDPQAPTRLARLLR